MTQPPTDEKLVREALNKLIYLSGSKMSREGLEAFNRLMTAPMTIKSKTTLDRLQELHRFYIEGTHFPEEAWRMKWEMLLNILIDEQKEKQCQKQ